MSVDGMAQPGSRLSGRTRSGGVAPQQLPVLAMLRRGLWAALHGTLVLATLQLLGGMRKQGQDLYFLYYQVMRKASRLGAGCSPSAAR
jgi:hypothetical protein